MRMNANHAADRIIHEQSDIKSIFYSISGEALTVRVLFLATLLGEIRGKTISSMPTTADAIFHPR